MSSITKSQTPNHALQRTGAAKTFTVTNTGHMLLSGISLSKDGTNAADFSVNATGMLASLAPGASTTFTVTFTPSAAAARNAAIHIASNVTGAANPFDIALVGTGNTLPTLTLPGSRVIAEATSALGAAVPFNVTANDAEDGPRTPTVSLPSGSTFPIGDTTVNVSAADSNGAIVSGSFVVRVRDTISPVVMRPSDVAVHATSPSGAEYFFDATVWDAVGVTSLTSVPRSGSIFPPGTTTVTVTAEDAANNTGTATFTVTVTPLTSAESWRYAYFGTAANAGIAADTADPDGDGYDNLFEFVAGLDPTNPASRFSVRVAAVPGAPTQTAIIFSPVFAGRAYVVNYKTSLTDATWMTLTNFSTNDIGSKRTVTDFSANPGSRFYQLEITLP